MTRRIAVGQAHQNDTTKYYINGSPVTFTNTKRMFKSIGLNIDHPETFFVQQGKITKIVNFKPTEVLEMLMESAGVAFYKEVAGQSRLIMRDKADKLGVTHERMKANFGPRLKLLEKERAKAAEFEYLNREIEKLAHLLARATRYSNLKTIATHRHHLADCEADLRDLRKLKKQHENEIDQLTRAHVSKSNMAQIDNINKEIADRQAKISTIDKNLSAQVCDLKNERKKLDSKTQEIQKLKQRKVQCQSKISEAQVRAEMGRRALAQLEKKLKDLGEEKNEIAVKMSSKDSNSEATAPLDQRLKTLQNDLLRARDQEANDKRTLKQLEEELLRGQRGMDSLEEEVRQYEKEMGDLRQSLQKAPQIDREINQLESNELRPLKKQLQELEDQEKAFREGCRAHNIKPEEFNVDFRVDSHNQNPYPDFNRSSVYGRALRLIKVESRFIKAMEAGSGGKLMNIVVESSDTVKQLLNKKCLDYFAVFMPLDQLRVPAIPDQVIEEARKRAKQFDSSLYLPSSKEVSEPVDPKFKMVQEYIAAQFLICDSLDAANAICNNGKFSVRVVTLDGDVFDPSGLVTGGHNHHRETLFTKWHKFKDLRAHILENKGDPKRPTLSRVELTQLIDKHHSALEELQGHKADLVHKAEKLERLGAKVKELTSGGTAQTVDDVKKKIEIFKAKIGEDKAACENIEADIKTTINFIATIRKGGDVAQLLRDKLKSLEAEAAKASQLHKRELSSLSEHEASIQKEQGDFDSLSQKVRDEEDSVVKLKALVEERAKFVANEEREIRSIEVATNHQTEIADLKAHLLEVQEKHTEKEHEKSEAIKKLEKAEGEIARLKQNLDKYSEEIHSAKAVLGTYSEGRRGLTQTKSRPSSRSPSSKAWRPRASLRSSARRKTSTSSWSGR